MKKNAVIIAAIMFLAACAHQGGYSRYDEQGHGMSAYSPAETTPLDTTGASMRRFDATTHQLQPQANIDSRRAAGFTGQEGSAAANTSNLSAAGQYGSIDSDKSATRRESGVFSQPDAVFERDMPIPTDSNRDLAEQSHVLNESADLHGRIDVGGPPDSESGRASSSSESSRSTLGEGSHSDTERAVESKQTLPPSKDIPATPDKNDSTAVGAPGELGESGQGKSSYEGDQSKSDSTIFDQNAKDAGGAQSFVESASDRQLSDRVRTMLNARTPGTIGTFSAPGMEKVQITSLNGTVTLKGSINSDVAKGNLISRIKGMPGVTSVNDQLTVTPETKSGNIRPTQENKDETTPD